MATINSPPKACNIIMSKNTDAPMAGNIPGMVAPQQSQLPLFSGKTKIGKPRNNANILLNETQH
jgi:hypothetical protein